MYPYVGVGGDCGQSQEGGIPSEEGLLELS